MSYNALNRQRTPYMRVEAYVARVPQHNDVTFWDNRRGPEIARLAVAVIIEWRIILESVPTRRPRDNPRKRPCWCFVNVEAASSHYHLVAWNSHHPLVESNTCQQSRTVAAC